MKRRFHALADKKTRTAAQDFRQAKENAEQANLTRSGLLTAAGRDLTETMQSLGLFSAALASHVHSAKGCEALTMLERGLDTLKGMLDMWRLAAGSIEPEFVTVPVRSMLDRIGTSHAMAASVKGLHFAILPTCNVMVRSDPNLLGCVVGNLVENAIRYTPTGAVWIDCAIVESRLRIAVHDTGIGIPEEHIDRIWDKFHQVGNPHQGLGLGLAVVQRLSRLLDHPMEVRSIPGGGSVFTLSLPLETAQIFHLPARTAVAARSSVTLKKRDSRFAVLVDDDALVLMALAATFEEWGYQVLTAETADHAVERLEASARNPDIVIIDYRLGDGRFGTEALLRIREKAGQSLERL